eukprot:1460063-Rhodomonas_salina.1
MMCKSCKLVPSTSNTLILVCPSMTDSDAVKGTWKSKRQINRPDDAELGQEKGDIQVSDKGGTQEKEEAEEGDWNSLDACLQRLCQVNNAMMGNAHRHAMALHLSHQLPNTELDQIFTTSLPIGVNKSHPSLLPLLLPSLESLPSSPPPSPPPSPPHPQAHRGR